MGVTAAATLPACERCASPLEHGDLRCAVCALPAPHVAVPIEVPRARILRCTECNAAIAFDPAHQAPACAFCRAVMTVEQPVDQFFRIIRGVGDPIAGPPAGSSRGTGSAPTRCSRTIR